MDAWIISLISHHNNRIGEGFSGFDIDELPWDKQCFITQRDEFLSLLNNLSKKVNAAFISNSKEDKLNATHGVKFDYYVGTESI